MKPRDVIRAIFPYYRRVEPEAKGRKKLALFRKMIKELRYKITEADSPFYSFRVYSEIAQAVRSHQGSPRRVLELGPGATLGALFCFLAEGAERAAGLDIQPIGELRPEFYHMLKDYLACVSGYHWWRRSIETESNPNIRYPQSWETVDADKLLKRVEYFSPYSASKLPFQDGEFDLIYSFAAMEHFDKPREAVREIRRVLSPGGLTIHEIDLAGHGGPDSLSHLLLNEKEYQHKTQKYGDGRGIEQIMNKQWTGVPFCNRLLAEDWRRIFIDEGFQILQFDTLCEMDVNAIDPVQFAAPFNTRSKNDLAPLVIRIVAKNTK